MPAALFVGSFFCGAGRTCGANVDEIAVPFFRAVVALRPGCSARVGLLARFVGCGAVRWLDRFPGKRLVPLSGFLVGKRPRADFRATVSGTIPY